MCDFAVYLGQFDKYDVSKGFLGVVCDTDGTDVGGVVELDVFVVGCVSSCYEIGKGSDQRLDRRGHGRDRDEKRGEGTHC